MDARRHEAPTILAAWAALGSVAIRPMSAAEMAVTPPVFLESWRDFMAGGNAGRLLLLVVVGTIGFQMQDVLLEPYGGQILGLSVGATTWLTAANAIGALAGFILAGRWMGSGHDTFRMAARGILVGIAAFSAVILAGLTGSITLFYMGAAAIGLGAGLFAVSTLSAAMALPETGRAGRGLALGAWGAAQATAAGLSIAIGGALRDTVGSYAMAGGFGTALATPSFGYSFVYNVEILVLFISLITLGPLVRTLPYNPKTISSAAQPGIVEFPT